jgi:hypothetical protein
MTVQISMRAASLRAALERATGSVAEVSSNKGALRISATAPSDAETWERLLKVFASAENWGAGDATGVTRVWIEIPEETP